MTDPSEMTAAEHAAVLAAVEHGLPVRMTSPDGTTRTVARCHVQERLDAGWTEADDPNRVIATENWLT